MDVSWSTLALTVFAGAPLAMGLMYFLIMFLRGNPAVNFGTMFQYGFGGGRYWRHVGGFMWRELMLFLWSLIALIPGLILGAVWAGIWGVSFVSSFNGGSSSLYAMNPYSVWRFLSQNITAISWAVITLGVIVLLLSIPIIVKSLAYSMQLFIVTMFPSVGVKNALKISMRVMNGHKGELFTLYLSFFGWYLLTLLTVGLVYLFYVGPYLKLTVTGFYEDVMRDALNRSVVTPQEMGLTNA